MEIKSYILENQDKVERALNGTPRGDSSRIGGVGQGAYFDGVWKKDGKELSVAEVDKLETALLAEYDRLGGRITKGGDKVKMGSFFNFPARKPHDEPKVKFEYRINGRTVEVPAGTELPGEVKAAKILAETVEAETVEEPKVKKGKKK